MFPAVCEADGVVWVTVELTVGSVTLLIKPVKLGKLASELTILSRLTELALASGTGVAVDADCGVGAAELAVLFINGGAVGGRRVEEVGAEPPMEEANPANEGMLLAMMSVMPARVGKTAPWSEPAGVGGGASSPSVGTNTVMSSSAHRLRHP